MATSASAPDGTPDGTPDDGERAFYRDELAGHTLVLAVDPHGIDEDLRSLETVVTELVDAGARVVLVGSADQIGAVAEVTVTRPLGTAPDLAVLTGLWAEVRAHGRAALGLAGPIGDAAAVGLAAAALAVRLGASKLVVTHGLAAPRLDTPGFIDETELDGDPTFAAAPWSGIVAAARAALAGGLPSVNLCRLADVGDELFTYEGKGMLVTARSYLDIGPLRADEFDAVDRLLRQGQDEGYLRPRSDDELARFLFIGFGARVATSGHLAGVGGLEVERYADAAAGEIVGLYAISRFVGEGVGRQLVGALVHHGAALGLDSVFACTTAPQVVGFFERCGFVVVDQAAVPATKWDGYDPARRAEAVAVKHDLRRRPV